MTSQESRSTVLIDDELDVLAELVPLAGQRIIELGCGAAQLSRSLLARYPESHVIGLEIDERQHAKNLALPQDGLQFVSGVAESIPYPDQSFDLAMMLKSLHHVPKESMAKALAEIARVLRPGAHLYVSEPVFAGPLNDVVRLFHDEGVVRAAAQAALDVAAAGSQWEQVAQRSFDVPVTFTGFADFEQRLMRATFANHQISDAKLAEVQAAFEPHIGPDGVRFERPMLIRLLRRKG